MTAAASCSSHSKEKGLMNYQQQMRAENARLLTGYEHPDTIADQLVIIEVLPFSRSFQNVFQGYTISSDLQILPTPSTFHPPGTTLPYYHRRVITMVRQIPDYCLNIPVQSLRDLEDQVDIASRNQHGNMYGLQGGARLYVMLVRHDITDMPQCLSAMPNSLNTCCDDSAAFVQTAATLRLTHTPQDATAGATLRVRRFACHDSSFILEFTESNLIKTRERILKAQWWKMGR